MERPGTAYLRPLSRCCLAGSLPSSSRHRPLSCTGETVALRRRSSPAASRCRADSPPTGGEGGGGLPVCRDDAAHSRAEHTTRIPTRDRSRSLKWRLITFASRSAASCVKFQESRIQFRPSSSSIRASSGDMFTLIYRTFKNFFPLAKNKV